MAPKCCCRCSRSCCSRRANLAPLYMATFLFKKPDPESTAKLDATLKQYDDWLKKQCLPIQAAVTTVTCGLAGAITGVCCDLICPRSICDIRNPQKLSVMERSFLTGPTWELSRNLAVIYGVNFGMARVMTMLRGKFDVQSGLAAGFCTGVTLSLVTGVRAPVEIMSVGAKFALVNAGLAKLEDKLAQMKAEGHVLFDKPRDRVSSIGPDLNRDHTMNFNTGFFTSNALSLPDRKEVKK